MLDNDYLKFFTLRWRWFRKEIKETNGRSWLIYLSVSLLVLALAFVFLVLGGYYLHENYENLPPLPDLGHKILPVWHSELHFLFKIGLLTSMALFIVGAMNEPHRMPYFFFMAGFWFLVRVISMTITPLGPPADVFKELPPDFDAKTLWDVLVVGLFSPTILFFSGHTGLPFLGHLLFERKIYFGFLSVPLAIITISYARAFASYSIVVGIILAIVWALIVVGWKWSLSLNKLFLVWSLIMAATVLLTREHYSIDVLGAYGMTYFAVAVGKILFSKIEKLCDRLDKNFETEE